MVHISTHEAASYIAGWSVAQGLIDGVDRNYAFNRIYSYVAPSHSESADDLVLPKRFSIGDALAICYQEVLEQKGKTSPDSDQFIQELFATFLPNPAHYAQVFQAMLAKDKGQLTRAFWWFYSQQEKSFALAASAYDLGQVELKLDNPELVEVIAAPKDLAPLLQGSSHHVANLRFATFDFEGAKLHLAFHPRPIAPASFSCYFGLQTPDQKAQKVKSSGLLHFMLKALDALMSKTSTPTFVLLSNALKRGELGVSEPLFSGFVLASEEKVEEAMGEHLCFESETELLAFDSSMLENKSICLSKSHGRYIVKII